MKKQREKPTTLPSNSSSCRFNFLSILRNMKMRSGISWRGRKRTPTFTITLNTSPNQLLSLLLLLFFSTNKKQRKSLMFLKPATQALETSSAICASNILTFESRTRWWFAKGLQNRMTFSGKMLINLEEKSSEIKSSPISLVSDSWFWVDIFSTSFNSKREIWLIRPSSVSTTSFHHYRFLSSTLLFLFS